MTGTADDPFARLDATAQADLVRTGDATPLDLVDAAIRRIEHLNPGLNALASTAYDQARERVETHNRSGVFAGVPTLVKDLMPYPGQAVGWGTRLFQGMPAPGGSDYTAALDRAGLIVLGKSTSSEFGLLGTTETQAHGPTRNPWNPDLSPGGSSGGAVAAVAAGMVPVAHASDGGGSVRGPSAFTGLFGFKPRPARQASNGMPAESPTAGLITEHCVSRSVRDSATWLRATERAGLKDPLPPAETLSANPPRPLKIGMFLTDVAEMPPSAEAERAVRKTADLCHQLGHSVTEIAPPDVDAPAIGAAFFTLTGVVMGAMLDQFRQMMGDGFNPDLLEPYTLELVRRATARGPEAVPAAMTALTQARMAAEARMQGFDMLLSPTVPWPAFPLGTYEPTEDPDHLMAFVQRVAGYTFIASVADWPAMSVPLFETGDGLPLGSHFAAPAGEEATLFALAFQLEQAAPWAPRLIRLQEKLTCLNG